MMSLKILRGVEACAGSQRSQQQFGRGHPLIEAPVLGRLIAYNPVLPRFDFELHTSKVLNSDFHKDPPYK
jgi:hypothetical protein